jgi:hypothetical protein
VQIELFFNHREMAPNPLKGAISTGLLLGMLKKWNSAVFPPFFCPLPPEGGFAKPVYQ